MAVRTIVTGGAGFIGRNVVQALNQRGESDILVVDDLGRGEKWKNLRDLRFDDLWSVQDFRAAVRANRLPNAAVVLHLGACSATTEPDADYLADNNYRCTRELCEWCLAQEARFVYASSAATYGDGSRGYSDADEATPTLRPLNMYGFSKQLFDLWALRRGLFDRIVGLKYFNVFGPYEDHKGEMRSVVHKAYGWIQETGEVRLFRSYRPEVADGEQRRDFVYVEDAVNVTLWFVDHPAVSGLFNCGSGRSRTWNDLARATFAALDREPVIRYVDMPESLRDRYQYFTEADMTKLRAAGCDVPFHSLEEGVARYVGSYLSAPDRG